MQSTTSCCSKRDSSDASSRIGIRLWLMRPRCWAVGIGGSVAALSFEPPFADDQGNVPERALFGAGGQVQPLLEQVPHHQA